jgi:lipopolysaccharide exporter
MTLSKRIGVSALWAVFTRVSVQMLSIINMVIIARLLGPENVGLFEKAAVVMGLLDVLTAIGLEAYLIQRRDVGRVHYDTTWTLNIMRGFVTGGMLLAFAPFAEEILNAPGVTPLMMAIALMPMIDGFANIGMVNFRRDLQFDREFRYLLFRRAVMVATCLSVAFVSPTPWALVGGTLAGSVAAVIASYVLSDFRPRLTLAAWRDLIGFAKWMFTYETVNGLAVRFEGLLLARYGTPSELAFYSKADDFAGLPSTEVAAPISKAVYPGLSAAQNDPAQLVHLFHRFLGLTLSIIVPLAAGLSLVAEPFVLTVLGSQWVMVVPLLHILAIRGVTRSVATNTFTAFLARGRMSLAGKLSLFFAAVRIILLPVGWLYGGLIGLAWASLASAVFNTSINLLILRYFRFASLRRLVAESWRTLFAAFAMSAAVMAMDNAFGVMFSSPVRLLLLVATGAVSYCAVLIGSWYLAGKPPGAESVLIDNIWKPGLRRLLRQRP